jgi:transcriptional regulator with XRE-family HTH domain
MSRRAPPTIDERASALGAEIRRLRRTRKLTQRQLAGKVPLSLASVSRIETGGQDPNDTTIASLARALQADPTSLLRLAGRRAPAQMGFEDRVIASLDRIAAELRSGFEKIEALLRESEAGIPRSSGRPRRG